ncbi:MAG: helix-turn-helix transcriptional regulator [Ruminococcaceae bacterium]|nr:helix-turn-helix transcriptional regulator [Oscillospiraceae bacterium]
MMFSDILRLLIEERGLTQKQLAKDLQIAVSTLGGYVQGTSEPDFDTLRRIAEYFEVSSDYLLDFRTGKTKAHGEDDVLRIYRALSPIQQELYIEQGKVLLRYSTKNTEHSENSEI